MALELDVEDMLKVFYSGDDDTDYEEKDDSDNERESSDYGGNKDDTDSEDLVIPTEDVDVQSLETLCLRSITSNFKRFNAAYNTSEDTAMQKNLLFLQRVYADHMISEESPVCIKDSCLDFLLNEYLTELNLEVLGNCSDKAILNRVSKIGHCFVKANLKPTLTAFCNFETEPNLVPQVLEFLPNLCVLNVQNVCNNDILKIIASSCPKLQELYIEDSIVTDEGVAHLIKEIDDAFQPCCQLTVLSLTNTKVEAHGLSLLLKHMPSLQLLNHNHVPLVLCSLHKEGMEKGNVQQYNLTSLDLTKYDHFSSLDLSNVLTVCTFVCPHVTKLSTPIENGDHLGLIPLFAELEDLTVDFFNTSVETLDMDNFLKSHGAKLRKLNLSCFSFSVPTLLEGCPKLEELSMRDVDFLWDDKYQTATHPPLNSLRKIYLENFIFEDLPIEMSMTLLLNHCPKVEVLEIEHCELADSKIPEALNNFCAKGVLKTLDFRCCDIRLGLLESILLTCSSLRNLNVNECDNILSDHFDNLFHIIQSKKQKVDLVVSDPTRSELNSINDDFFDHYDFSDDSDDYFFNGYGYSTPYDYEDDEYGSDF